MTFAIERRLLMAAAERVRIPPDGRHDYGLFPDLSLWARGGELFISSGSHDLSARYRIGPTQSPEFLVTIPGPVLDVLARSNAEMLRCDSVQGGREISADGLSFTFRDGLSERSHVELDGSAYRLPAAWLRSALISAAHAASTDLVRHYLCGVYVHVMDAYLRVCATDGHRMVVVACPAPVGLREMPGFIIPSAIAQWLKDGFFVESSGDVLLSVAEMRVSMRVDDAFTSFVAIDGTYPDYWKVMPKPEDTPNLLRVDAAALYAAVYPAAAQGSDWDPAVALHLGAGDKESGLVVEARTKDVRARHNISGAVYTGTPMTVSFKPQYLRDMIATLSGEVEVYFQKTPEEPHRFTSSMDPGRTGVIMPVQGVELGGRQHYGKRSRQAPRVRHRRP